MDFFLLGWVLLIWGRDYTLIKDHAEMTVGFRIQFNFLLLEGEWGSGYIYIYIEYDFEEIV